jgi:exosortase
MNAPAGRHVWFFCLLLSSLAALHQPLDEILRLAVHDERYTYILGVTPISLWLVWLKRADIFKKYPHSTAIGPAVYLAGLLLGLAATLDTNASITIRAISIVAAAVGAFTWSYGLMALKEAAFPVAFLALIVPLPSQVIEFAITVLQAGSAEATHWLLNMTGIPVLRAGYTFSLPAVDIEVARECSGIRSSMSLLVCSIVAGHMLLQSWWGRVGLGLVVVPIVILKNAIRIVTISLLGMYVDPEYFHGVLHRRAGFLFSVPAIAMLMIALWALRRWECRSERRMATEATRAA